MRRLKVKTIKGSTDLIKINTNRPQTIPDTIRYTDSKGNDIKDINDWYSFIFKSSKKEKHWKDGRSAKSIADFMMNENGETFIKKLVSELLNENVSFRNAIPELEIRFDDYGHGREHDLGIWGTTDSNRNVFIGVEAKVDESFNEKISEAYLSAKLRELNGKETNAPKRIEELLKKHFREIKPEHLNLRYQLFYATMGTLAAKADISILLIIVFKTNLYNEVIGIENYKDYIQFISSINSKQIPFNRNIDIHELKIGDKSMYSIYMNIDKKNLN